MTVGAVWRPTFANWIDGFQLSADWYEIDMKNRVGSLGAQRIIDDCFAGDQSLCALVFRNTGTGVIERVLNVNLNTAAALTSGVDLEVRYDFEPDFIANQDERLNLRLFAGYLGENSVTTTVYRDDVGSINSPKYNATATLGYDIGSYGIRLVGRYIHKTMYDVTWVEGRDVDNNWAASSTTANLILSYRGKTDAGSAWTASFNVTNLFDRDPPIFPSQSQRGGQQNISNSYDAFGRRYQLSLNYSF